MKTLDKGTNDEAKNVEPREGQRRPLSSNTGSSRCPSLSYEQVESSSPDNVHRAYAILFEAVLRRRKEKANYGTNENNKIPGDLFQSFDLQPGRSKNS